MCVCVCVWINRFLKNPIDKFMISVYLDCVKCSLKNKSTKSFLLTKENITQSIDIFKWMVLRFMQ